MPLFQYGSRMAATNLVLPGSCEPCVGMRLAKSDSLASIAAAFSVEPRLSVRSACCTHHRRFMCASVHTVRESVGSQWTDGPELG